jgi:hypothetical protein
MPDVNMSIPQSTELSLVAAVKILTGVAGLVLVLRSASSSKMEEIEPDVPAWLLFVGKRDDGAENASSAMRCGSFFSLETRLWEPRAGPDKQQIPTSCGTTLCLWWNSSWLAENAHHRPETSLFPSFLFSPLSGPLLLYLILYTVYTSVDLDMS